MVASIGVIASPSQGVAYYEKDGYYARDDPVHREASAWAGRGADVEAMSLMRGGQGKTFNPRRWYTQDDELIHHDGQTYAFSKQWGRPEMAHRHESLDQGFSTGRYTIRPHRIGGLGTHLVEVGTGLKPTRHVYLPALTHRRGGGSRRDGEGQRAAASAHHRQCPRTRPGTAPGVAGQRQPATVQLRQFLRFSDCLLSGVRRRWAAGGTLQPLPRRAHVHLRRPWSRAGYASVVSHKYAYESAGPFGRRLRCSSSRGAPHTGGFETRPYKSSRLADNQNALAAS